MEKKYLLIAAVITASLILLFPVSTSVPLVHGQVDLPDVDLGYLPNFFNSNITLFLKDASFSINTGDVEICFDADLCDVKSRAYVDDEGKTLVIKSVILMENCKLTSDIINGEFAKLSLNLDIYMSEEFAYYDVNKDIQLPLILSFFNKNIYF